MSDYVIPHCAIAATLCVDPPYTGLRLVSISSSVNQFITNYVSLSDKNVLWHFKASVYWFTVIKMLIVHFHPLPTIHLLYLLNSVHVCRSIYALEKSSGLFLKENRKKN